MSKLKFVPVVLALLVSLTGIAFGQETAGEIQGTVKDPQGAVIPGATVTITGSSIGFNRTVTTDAEGYYRARQVPAGIYTVSTEGAAGFAGQTKERVQVVLGQATQLDFNLAVTGTTAQVNVVDEGGIAIDPTDSKVQENITAREIENLPKGTSFSSLLRTTTAARPEPLSGQFQINGGSGSENSFIIDGQELTNFRTGVLNSNNDIPFQSVQEIQVKSSGFEAEFGGATGGVVNLVTKSGTNEFHGEFGIAFGVPEFDAGRRPVLSTSLLTTFSDTGQYVKYLGQNRDAGTDVFPTGSIGGPIIKDKLWFFAIHSPRYVHINRVSSYVNPVVPVVGGTTVNEVPVGVVSTRETDIFNYSQLKIDASPFDKLRLSSSFTWNPIVQKGVTFGGSTIFAAAIPFNNFGGSIGTLTGAALAERQGGRQNSNNFRIEGVVTPTNSLVLLGRYSRGFLNEKLASYFIPETQRIRVRQCTGAFALGAGCTANVGAPLNFQNVTNNFNIVRDVSIRNQVNADASYLVSGFGGRHEFKGGYEYNTILNDVLQGHPVGRLDLYYGRTTYPVGFGAFPTPPPSITPAPGSRGVGVLYRFATQGLAKNKNQALYIQDKWQPTSRLTLNLGGRIEKEDLPAFNGQVTNLKFGFGDKFAPRLGVAFDLTGDGKTRLSASYGRFYDRLKFELPRGSFGGDFYRVDYFDLPATGPIDYQSFPVSRIIGNFGDPVGGGCPISSSGLTRCQYDFRIPSNLASSAAFGGVDPDLKPFRQSEFAVEVQREINNTSVFRARYLHRNVDNAVEDAGFLTASGSEFYIIGNPGSGLHAKLATDAGFQRLAKPERKYDAAQFEFDTRWVRNLNLNMSYTYSRLFGNYSGLANSDEDGRTSPGVNRLFDLPFVGFTASGNTDNGRLATDRPHVFKASGTYSYGWFGRNTNTSDLSFFTTIQSGTPQTTFVDIYGIPIPKTVRGDLGRSETFTQTDINFTHRYKFGNDGRYGLAFDINVLNLFNENNVLTLDNDESSLYYLLDQSEVSPTGNFVEAVNILTSRGVINELNASVAHDPGFSINQAYKLPNAFQAGRSVRFGFRFLF